VAEPTDPDSKKPNGTAIPVRGNRAVKVTPEYYRKLAKQSRALAAGVNDADKKAHLLNVAEQYDKLAAKAAALSVS